MDFAAVVEWLDLRIGKRVAVTIAAEDPNSVGAFSGELREGTREWSLISPLPGERRTYDVGDDAGLLLIEDDLLSAESEFGHAPRQRTSICLSCEVPLTAKPVAVGGIAPKDRGGRRGGRTGHGSG